MNLDKIEFIPYNKSCRFRGDKDEMDHSPT